MVSGVCNISSSSLAKEKKKRESLTERTATKELCGEAGEIYKRKKEKKVR